VRKSIVVAIVLAFAASALLPTPTSAGVRRKGSVFVFILPRAPLVAPEDRLPVEGIVSSSSRKPPRKRVAVKYYKKRPNGGWRLLDTNWPMMNRKREFHTEFKRHTKRGACKLTARYPGAKGYVAYQDSARLRCKSGRF
jgi:hypothetical protein